MLLVLLSGCGPDSALSRAHAGQRLKKEFRAAHREQDPDRLLNLYYLEGVRDSDRTLLKIAARDEVVLPLQSLKFKPAGPEQVISYTFEGLEFESTLPVEKTLSVRYSTPDSLTLSYPVGYREGRYFFVTARPVQGPVEGSP